MVASYDALSALLLGAFQHSLNTLTKLYSEGKKNIFWKRFKKKMEFIAL